MVNNIKKAGLLLLSLVLLLLISGCGQGDKKTYINIGTTSTSSSHYPYFVAIAKSINNSVPEVQVNPIESGATVDNLKRIGTGEFDMGLTGHPVAYENYQGIGTYEGKKNDKLRVMWYFGTVPITIVVRADAGINSIYDLNGKPFSAGGTGSSTEKMVKQAFDVLGISPKFYPSSFDDAAQAMQDQNIVGLAKNSGGLKTQDSIISQLQTQMELKFLSIKPEDAKKIQEEFPHYVFAEIADGVYKDQGGAVLSIAQATYVTGSSDISEDLAYKMVKAVFNDRDAQEVSFPGLKEVDYLEVIKYATFPLHSGTVKYLEEQGVEVSAEFIPPEYKG